jgi:hypothetical protein
MVRFVAVFAAAVAALALAGAAMTAAPAHPLTVSLTVDGNFQTIGCCGVSFNGDPATVVLPGIGRATLTVGLTSSGPLNFPPNGATFLSVYITTASGDTLVIFGSAATGTTSVPLLASGTWSVSPLSTGRFAAATGSGTWSVILTVTESGTVVHPAEVVLALAGEITLR